MKKTITYNELWIIEQDIMRTKEHMPALSFFMENRFNNFMYSNDNQMHFVVLHSRMKEIQKKYIEHDEEGNPIMHSPEEGKRRDWKYLETIVGKNGQLLSGQEVADAYLAEAGEFLNRSITVHL